MGALACDYTYYPSPKRDLSIAAKNAVVRNILQEIAIHGSFLLLGHEHPDEDCIASLVAFALLLTRCNKRVEICCQGPIRVQISFLIDICLYNGIAVHLDTQTVPRMPDALVILDTPNPGMIYAPPSCRLLLSDSTIRKIELDHHLFANAACCGDPGYSLIARASSTCEIIAYLCYKLARNHAQRTALGIRNLYSRNVVLSILTGMIGDAKTGAYLISRKDRALYTYFTQRLNTMLREKTKPITGNIASTKQILHTLESLSAEEHAVYQTMVKNVQHRGSISLLLLNQTQTQALHECCNAEHFVSLIKMATSNIAESISGIGISAYPDPTQQFYVTQWRVRTAARVKQLDLRLLLSHFAIQNGGGHAGAIGFRFFAHELINQDLFTEALVAYLDDRLHHMQSA